MLSTLDLNLTLSNKIYKELLANKLMNNFEKCNMSKINLNRVYNSYVEKFESKISNLYRQKNFIAFTTIIDAIMINYTSYINNNILMLRDINKNVEEEGYLALNNHILEDDSFIFSIVSYINKKMVNNGIFETDCITYDLIKYLVKEVIVNIQYQYLPIPIRWDIMNVDIDTINKSDYGSYKEKFRYNSNIELFNLNIPIKYIGNPLFNDKLLYIVNNCYNNFTLELNFDMDTFELRSMGE